jgi:hypothetical protein
VSITYPVDLLADFPGWTTEFDLLWRQEQSRVASGRTYLKDLGSPLWRLSAQSIPLSINKLDEWRARLASMEGGAKTFIGRSMSRCYPIAYPNGSWPTGVSFNGDAELNEVDEDGVSVKVGGLPSGFKLSVGDMVQIGDTDLHRVMEQATAGVGGVTGLFEVRPHIWPGVTGGDSPATIVKVKQPGCVMAIVPGSISSTADRGTGRGSVSFQAVEAR